MKHDLKEVLKYIGAKDAPTPPCVSSTYCDRRYRDPLFTLTGINSKVKSLLYDQQYQLVCVARINPVGIARSVFVKHAMTQIVVKYGRFFNKNYFFQLAVTYDNPSFLQFDSSSRVRYTGWSESSTTFLVLQVSVQEHYKTLVFF